MGRNLPVVIEVFPESALTARPRLFAALSQALPVTFRRAGAAGADVAGLIVFDENRWRRHGHPRSRNATPVLVVDGDPAGAGAPEEVRLTGAAELDPTLRGITLYDRPTRPVPRPVRDDEVTIARAVSGPVWTLTSRPGPIHRVRSVLPELAADQVLWSLLSQRAIAAVAVVQFLRAAAGQDGSPPALRATFMFDDPNLRRPSYGFLHYERLVEHADAHGYHVAMAMVPLDAGRAHPATVSLFARRRDRLSLVVHGNDHLRQELWAVTEPRRALAVAAQARRRIDGFERRTGVAVDRVMTPPHGLCSEEMAHALTAVGFEAICAEHPLPWTDELPTDRVMAAWRPADVVDGSVVIPRMPLESSDASIALRAFLRQPLVIYGHHGDLADGLDRLADVATFVNRMGDVRWMPMADILLSNHEVLSGGPHASVRPYARRVRLELDDEVETVTVQPPEDLLTDGGVYGWSTTCGAPIAFGERTAVPAGGRIDIVLRGAAETDPGSVAPPRWQPWPYIRRGAAEGRDRTAPLLSAVWGRHAGRRIRTRTGFDEQIGGPQWSGGR